MRESAASMLAALQLADSALPVARFVHSHGLEALSRTTSGDVAPTAVIEFVRTTTLGTFATLDAPFVAHGHRARSVGEFLELDERLTARKLTRGAREASESCGRSLARLARDLVEDSLVAEAVAAVGHGETPGNVAVLSGVVLRAAGLDRHDAVLLEIRGMAANLASAAVRLGLLSPLESQVLLWDLREDIAAATVAACDICVEDVTSCAIEQEILMMVHGQLDGRTFAT